MKELRSLRYLHDKLHADVEDGEKARARIKITRLTAWIEGIEDPMIHDIFVYRFIRGFTWVKTAQRIGGGNTEDGVRMLAKRYLEKC